MIYTAILDFNEDTCEGLKIPESQPYIRKRIEEAKAPRRRIERKIAYAFMLKVFYEIYGKEARTLLFEKTGKPYFEGDNPYLSVSHTDGFCAVSFSDFPVGVDIETDENLEKSEETIARFVNKSVQNLLKRAEKPEICCSFYRLKNGEFEKADAASFKNEVAEDTALWVMLEAVLKCRGGFCAYPDIENIIPKSKIAVISNGGAACAVAVITKD